MLSHFPDPDMPDYRDMRLLEESRVIPEAVIESYDLQNASITAMETGSYNIHFKVVSQSDSSEPDELFDLRRSNRPSQPGNLTYESEILIHLRERGFDLAPEIVPTAKGEPNLWFDDTGWTLFRWMGDGPGTHKQALTEAGSKSAAHTLAAFHVACENFTPTAKRGDWPVFTPPTVDHQTWLLRAESLAEHYDASIEGGAEDLRQMARRSADELATM
jgi:hypothetical protein